MAAPAGAEEYARFRHGNRGKGGFVRPSGAEWLGPRVPLRSTRGYSPQPLRGQGIYSPQPLRDQGVYCARRL